MLAPATARCSKGSDLFRRAAGLGARPANGMLEGSMNRKALELSSTVEDYVEEAQLSCAFRAIPCWRGTNS